MGLSRDDIEFVQTDGGNKVAMRNTKSAPEAMDDAVLTGRVGKKRLTQLIGEHLDAIVHEHLKNMDFSTMVELHAEVAVEKAIQDYIAHGWAGGHNTVEKEVAAKVRDMVSFAVAAQYDVEVDVRIVRKSK